jgi:hypothetical protein
MNRYSTTPVFNRFDGKRVLRTTTYPKIPISNDDIFIIASESDYLDSLAQKYYGNSTYWWIIALANNLKATLKAPSGKQLRIPRNAQEVLVRFNRENNSQ